MQLTRIVSFAAAFLLLGGALPYVTTLAQKFETADGGQPIVIRVGAIYYDDSAEQYQRVRTILSAFENADRNSNRSKRPVTFKLVGTYDEVYHWYRSNQIDLAVMNPGPLALLLKEFGHEEMSEAFVGTRAIAPGSTSIASEGGIVPRDKYNSIMVLNRESLKSQFPSLDPKKPLLDQEARQIIDLVLDKARQRQTQFLFVHPFSTSGYIFPRKFLKERTGVDLTPSDYELTYSHSVSLTEIRKSGYDAHGRLESPSFQTRHRPPKATTNC